MNPTPTKNILPLRQGDFTNLVEALDYAAEGITGYNFYDRTGKLITALPYKKLRKMNNLSNLIGGVVQFQNDDRAVSWLPFYHDMGLVGMVLAPLAAQVSVDYLNPRDFAMRPRMWLKLMSDNRATVSFGSAMGYELCQRRLRSTDVKSLDLSPWRVAGIGAETIRPEPLIQFADQLAPAGFKKNAFVDNILLRVFVS